MTTWAELMRAGKPYMLCQIDEVINELRREMNDLANDDWTEDEIKGAERALVLFVARLERERPNGGWAG